jgi:hypothetical protein
MINAWTRPARRITGRPGPPADHPYLDVSLIVVFALDGAAAQDSNYFLGRALDLWVDS